MRNSIINEKMAGNYMDRNRAYQAAEQALRQASALLQSNSDSCVDGCTNSNVTDVGPAVNSMPSSWPINKDDPLFNFITTVKSKDKNNNLVSKIYLDEDKNIFVLSQYLINQLPDSMRPAGKESCKAYSIMSRGQGIDTRSIVMLQTIAFVCPI
jgi:type IV pilus assembly protein PilX